MKYFIAVVITSLLIIASPTLVLAEASKLVFTSVVNQVAVGVISDKLTVQLQDSSGASVIAGKTIYLNFKSSSPTGEFSTSATNWEKMERTHVSSNWSNRNFYYRDATAGVAVITVEVEGGSISSASLSLSVGSDGVTSGSTNDELDEGEDNTQNSNVTNSGGSSGAGSTVISAHSSQTNLSNTAEKLSWEISAGRSRRALVDTPVIFETKTVAGSPSGFVSFYWSFGDGATYSGRDVSHSYHFPGTYQVVVNAKSNDEVAVARTTINIEEPKLKISWLETGAFAARVKNDQPLEINLGGFRVVSGVTTLLTVPHDTIIAGGGEVTMPLPGASTFSGLIGADLALYSPAGFMMVQKTNVPPIVPNSNLAAVTAAPATAKIKMAVVSNETAASTGTIIELTPPENISWWQRVIKWFKS